MVRGKKLPDKPVVIVIVLALMSVFSIFALYLILVKLESPNRGLALGIFILYVLAIVFYTKYAFRYKNIRHI